MKTQPRVVTITGGKFTLSARVLPILSANQALVEGCPECGCSKSDILITFFQEGILEHITWEILECKTCHNRYVVESTLAADGDSHE